VCNHLVAIEGGQLLRSAPLGSFTEGTGTLAVEVDEDTARLAERLAAQGLKVAVDGRAVLVSLAGDTTYDLVRDAVAELGLPLLRIEHRRHRLEDLFRDAPPTAASGAAGPAPAAGPPPDAATPAAPPASPPA
jgi:ABC-2 type transport system ATP-binding protein